MKIIAGLGNPGKKYELTRHNVGFMILDQLADDMRVDFSESKYKCHLAEVRDNTHDKIFLVKPQTYMNLSGESIAPLAKFFKVSIQDILIVYDDLDLPLAKLRFAKSGRAAGHNGIKSLISCLGSQDFPRLKFGIGRPKIVQQPVSDFVLQKFSSDEQKIISPQIQKSVEAIQYYLKCDDIAQSMNEFN